MKIRCRRDLILSYRDTMPTISQCALGGRWGWPGDPNKCSQHGKKWFTLFSGDLEFLESY